MTDVKRALRHLVNWSFFLTMPVWAALGLAILVINSIIRWDFPWPLDCMPKGDRFFWED